MKWEYPIEGKRKDWELYDSAGKLLDILSFDYPAACYRNREGVNLGKEFNAARVAIERGHVEPEQKPQETQGRLAL